MESNDAGIRYAEAKRLYQAGDHRAALALLDALDIEFPGTKNILLARAECLIKLGDRDATLAACERVLAAVIDPRAERLLSQARALPPPLPLSVSDGWQPVGDGLSGAFNPLPVPRTRHRFFYTLPALVLGGALVIGVTSRLAWTLTQGPESTGGYTESEVQHAERRGKTAAQARADRELAESKKGIREIPESDWRLTAVNGVPVWEPGIYRQVPCGSHYFQAAADGATRLRTIDVFIPTAYGERTEDLFPTLTISMPYDDPGFIELKAWAESRGVVLIVLNSSHNGPAKNNLEAQDAAYEILSTSLRAHPALNFATGMSGGAMASWLAVNRRPDIFSGLLMMGQAGYDDVPLPPHLRIGFIRGRQEPNTRHMIAMFNHLQNAGYDVRQTVVPGAHVMGPVPVRTKMLDWMLESGKRDLGLDAAAP